jgi:hypothetical protein
MKFAYFNPTVFAIEDVPPDVFVALEDMVNEAHKNKQYNDSGNPQISIRGGQQVQLIPNEFNLNTDRLKQFVEKSCDEYLSKIFNVNGYDNRPYEPKLVSAWTIRQTAGDYQALHAHEAHISGNIYIDVPNNISLDNVSDANLEFKLPTIKNPAQFVFVDTWRFRPQPLQMVIFPSYIAHTVYPWKGDGYRTILAWDVKLHQKVS